VFISISGGLLTSWPSPSHRTAAGNRRSHPGL